MRVQEASQRREAPRRSAKMGVRFTHAVKSPLLRILLGLLVFSLLAPAARAGRGITSFTCMVRMRDGTLLATNVYLPRFPRQAFPVILVRTPDGKDEVTKRVARYVGRRDFALVVQDTRGRGQSQGGDTIVFLDDGWGRNQDGHDTLQWIARQPWCDGRIGTWGVSAMGVMENMLAPDAPPALKAQHVMMAFSDMYAQAAYQGGVLRQSLVEGWLAEHHLAPINRQTLLSHPQYDALWEQFSAESQAARVNVPGVFWGGWYDVFLQGTINSFMSIHNQGGPGARGKCRLIVGPWNHNDAKWLADPRNAGSYPRAADPFRFFQYWLQCDSNGVPGDRAVHYYVMGDRCDPAAPGNCWRTADNWPPPATATNYYLHADGTLQPQAPLAADASRQFRYDPNHPVPTVGGQNMYGSCGPLDQRPVESRADVLIFSSEPLSQPIEVTGRIFAELFISSDCPDTDFTAKLSDVYPDGRSLLLCDGILRARYGDSHGRVSQGREDAGGTSQTGRPLRNALSVATVNAATEAPPISRFARPTLQVGELLEPGQVYRLKIDLWSTSIVFNKGHRIRVAISSSNSPRFQPNPNTGRLPTEGSTKEETRIATNTVYLSAEHPSHVILPIYGKAE